MKKLLILLACASVLFSCDAKNESKDPTPPGKKDLYSEPILTFGASIATIKKQEKRVLEEEDNTGLMYSDKGYDVIYLFKNDKLTSSGVILPLSTSIKELTDFLNARYKYFGEEDDILIWTSKNETMGVGVSVKTLGIFIAYVPITKSDTIHETIEDMNKLLNNLQ